MAADPALLRRRVPAILVCGIDDTAVQAVALSGQLSLPGAVTVRHTIDAERQVLTRSVSDLTGLLERVEIELAHACVSCAIREDIVPTLERLASDGRWGSVVACLPVGAEAAQICRVVGWQAARTPHLRIAAVVAAMDGTTVTEDLLGDDLLAERGRATSVEDRRGVGEVGCRMVEYADTVCLTEPAAPAERSLLAALARPGVPIVGEAATLDAAALAAGVHRHREVEAWVAEVRREPLPALPPGGVWRLDLSSERPFHPLRFHEELALLGGGPRRSRGCFWLPTRPGVACVWDGAGGQTSIGTGRSWSRDAPLSRIVITGLDDAADEHARIRAAFDRCLLTDDELATRGTAWPDTWDGLEPWLGPVDDAA